MNTYRVYIKSVKSYLVEADDFGQAEKFARDLLIEQEVSMTDCISEVDARLLVEQKEGDKND